MPINDEKFMLWKDVSLITKIEFETMCLASGSEFLPVVAIKVRDSIALNETETEQYYEWIEAQWEQWCLYNKD